MPTLTSVQSQQKARSSRRASYLMGACLLLSLFPLQSGCFLRKKTSVRPLESYIPSDSALVVQVPRGDHLVAAYKAVSGRFADLPGAKQGLERAQKEVEMKLGIDINQPDSLRQVGLDPLRGAYFFMTPSTDRGCVVAATTAAENANGQQAAHAFLQKLYRLGDQGVTFRQAERDTIKLTEVLRTGETQPETGWVFVPGAVIACAGDTGVAISDYLVSLSKSESGIDKEPNFVTAYKSASKMNLLWVYLNTKPATGWIKGGRDGRKLKPLVEALSGYRALSAGLSANAEHLSVEALLLSQPDQEKAHRELSKGIGSPARFAEYLPRTAGLFLAKASVNVEETLALAHKQQKDTSQLDKGMAEFKEKTGLDLNQDILKVLSGRYLLGLDRPNFGISDLKDALNLPALLPRMPIYLAAQVRDKQKAAALLSNVEQLLRQRQIAVEVQGGKEPVYQIKASAEGPALVGFTLRGDLLLVSTAEFMPALLGRPGSGPPPKLDGANAQAAMVSAEDAVLYLDLVQLASLLRAFSLLRPDPEMALALQILDKMQDLGITSKWRKEGMFTELKIRFR